MKHVRSLSRRQAIPALAQESPCWVQIMWCISDAKHALALRLFGDS